jgi:hypothetical protein
MVRKGQTIFKVKLSNQNVFLIKIEFIKGKSLLLVKLASKSNPDIKTLHRRVDIQATKH